MLWEGDGVGLAINHCSADAGSAVAAIRKRFRPAGWFESLAFAARLVPRITSKLPSNAALKSGIVSDSQVLRFAI